jgi:Uncharacterized membrane protein (homolog of Drosophila rhomboid)
MYVSRGSFWSNMPPVIKNLVIINAIMMGITYLARTFMLEKFALFYFESPFFQPYQYVSHMFMHGNLVHLLFNMYALVIFGMVLEQIWGSKKFLIYYLVTGLGAALLHTLALHIEATSLINAYEAGNFALLGDIQTLLGTPTVGASGAVYGVLLAYGMLFPNNVLQLIFPPIALKAKWFVIIFGVIELSLGIYNPGSNVAHFAHLGGMIFGFFLILYWKKRNKMYY